MTELERPGGDAPEPQRGRKRRWPWLIIGVVVAAGKLEVLHFVEHHRVETIVMLAIGLVASVVRINVSAIAVTAAVLFAVALAPPFFVGAGIALGLFVVLMTLFYAVSTVLHVRQNRSSASAGLSARPSPSRRSRAAQVQ